MSLIALFKAQKLRKNALGDSLLKFYSLPAENVQTSFLQGYFDSKMLQTASFI